MRTLINLQDWAWTTNVQSQYINHRGLTLEESGPAGNLMQPIARSSRLFYILFDTGLAETKRT